MAKNEPFIRSGSPLYLQIAPFIKAASEENAELEAGFSTRQGGTSQSPYDTLNLGLHTDDEYRDVINNRKLLTETAGFSLDSCVVSEQVHGSRIVEITQKHKGTGATSQSTAIPETDGIFTREKGILLTSMYADCVPLYFFAPKVGLTGLAHAGWKGTVANIAGSMIEAFKEAGAEEDEILAAIGPSISMPCYEVDERVMNEVGKLPLGNAGEIAKETTQHHYLLDLKEVNRKLLRSQGVKEDRIYTSSYCTYEQADLFYSHRRDQGKTGRMMSFIGMK
ncbi:peptidoglycan editing factor PgeF [Bacillus sp. H-16]|uniref:peptidoglycan editing factor PgeF n=1 Tax=Alteribacter salitolerans TaxID=2912333 RepID=UPI00196346AA|nr:peptidoglycan editing factor PgeF [Alteribacter salitolerans]MBM7095853.1 peptidoglycan editing factor PgeF [Alteribacter salitolerans]